MIASGKLPERQPESDRARVDRADGKREIEAAGERERPGNILPGPARCHAGGIMSEHDIGLARRPWGAGCDRSR